MADVIELVCWGAGELMRYVMLTSLNRLAWAAELPWAMTSPATAGSGLLGLAASPLLFCRTRCDARSTTQHPSQGLPGRVGLLSSRPDLFSVSEARSTPRIVETQLRPSSAGQASPRLFQGAQPLFDDAALRLSANRSPLSSERCQDAQSHGHPGGAYLGP
jgi:hypothetical protein